MYCPNCGKQLPEGARFCGACGSMLVESVNMDAAESTPTEEVTASGYEEGPNTAERTAAPEPAEEPSQANVTAVPEHAGEQVLTEEERAPEANEVPAGPAKGSRNPVASDARAERSAVHKPCKNSVLPVILIVAVIAVIVLVNVIMALLPTGEKSWQEQYDLGVRYLSESDYEQAIVAFTAAIEIDAKQAEPYVGRAEAYVGMYGVTDEEEYLPLAISDYETALSLDDTLEEVYVCEAEIYLILEDYDSAAAVLDQGLSIIPESMAIGAKREEVAALVRSTGTESDSGTGEGGDNTPSAGDTESSTDEDPEDADSEDPGTGEENAGDSTEEEDGEDEDAKAAANDAMIREEIEDNYLSTLVAVAASVASDPSSAGFNDLVGDSFRELVSELTTAQLWDQGDGIVFGIYPGGYIYYGEMTDGVRSGHGTWMLCSSDDVSELEVNYGIDVNRIFTGEWSGDYPNGAGVIYIFDRFNEKGNTDVTRLYCYEMNFVDGKGDGEGTFTVSSANSTYPTGSTTVRADNGQWISISDEEITPSEEESRIAEIRGYTVVKYAKIGYMGYTGYLICVNGAYLEEDSGL